MSNANERPERAVTIHEFGEAENNSTGTSTRLATEPGGGAMNAGAKTPEFDVQKTGEELRGYLKSETDCEAASKKALQDKAAAALKAGELLTEVAKNHKGHFDDVCRIAGLEKSRVYELMKAAKGGLKALEAMQEGNRQRQQKYRERKKARTKSAKAAKSKADLEKVSVTVGGVTESPEEKAQRQKETEERRAQTREKREGVAEALTDAMRALVKLHGIDPGADTVRQAIETFVAAVTPAVAK